MTTPQTTALPAIALAQGPHSFTTPVTAGLSTIALHVDTTQHLNVGVSLQVTIDWSADGTTWNSILDQVVPGGIRFGDNNVVLTSHDPVISLPRPDLANRQLRVSFNSIGGSFMSSGGSLVVS